MGLHLMKTRLNQSGNNLRDESIQDSRNMMKMDFKNDPSYHPEFYKIKYDKRQEKDNCIPIRIYNQKFSTASGNTEQFQTLIEDKISVGDVLFDESEEEYWLCTESFNVDNIHYKGKLTYCNYNLYWQDKTGNIIERRCFISNASAYNNGETGNKIITLASNQFLIYMPIDENTVNLRNGIRMFIDYSTVSPNVYELTRPDNVSFNASRGGVTYFIFTQTERRDADKEVVLDTGEKVWIADYITPALLPPENPSETTLSSVISGSNTLRAGFARTYSVAFTDEDGMLLTDVDFEWNINCDFGDKITVIINDDKTIRLQVNDEGLIGSSFLLEVLVDDSVIDNLNIVIDHIY